MTKQRRATALLFLLTLALVGAALAAPVLGQGIGIACAPAKLNYGTLAQGQSATVPLTVYNSGTTQLNFTAQVAGVQGSVSPSSAVLPAKSNMTIAVTVTGSGPVGAQKGAVLINSTASGSGSKDSALVLPAIAVGVSYTATGATLATSILSPSSGLWVLGVLILVAVVLVAYLVVLKKGGKL
jgi:hypothetical protein